MFDTRHIEAEEADERTMLQETGLKPSRLRRAQRALAEKRLPEDLIATGYKAFTFLVCPVSGEVLNEQ